jgi:hypothetical protein
MSAQRPNPAAIDLIAQRVVEMLEPRLIEALSTAVDNQRHGVSGIPDNDDQDVGLVGVAELARRLGRSPDWVRDHADELGVIRFGNGTGKPRLWFHAEAVAERMRQMQGGTVDRGQPAVHGDTPPLAKRNGNGSRTTTPLLEIRGQG